MLDNLALFVHIVEAGSLNQAATQLHLPASTLTRRLQKLETQLNCRLLHRSARKTVPTPEGWQYYEQCRPLVHALKQATEQLNETMTQMKGRVRVLAPVNLSNGLLAPAWLSFMQRYPNIQLVLQLSNAIEALPEHNADLGIRIGHLPDSTLNTRLLGRISKMLLVAAPAYLAQKPPLEAPTSLPGHDCIISEPISSWNLHHPPSGENFRYTPPPRFSVNELGLALEAACAGVGILFCPISLCYPFLQSGQLVNVLPGWASKPRDINMIWPQQRYVPARVRALITHLAEHAAQEPLLNGAI